MAHESYKIDDDATEQGGIRVWLKWLVWLLLFVVLVAFAAMVWFAYRELTGQGDGGIPLIRAEEGEIKRPPEERGGLDLVNGDSYFVRDFDKLPVASGEVERLLPRPDPPPRSAIEALGLDDEADKEPATNPADIASGEEEDVAPDVAAAPPVADSEHFEIIELPPLDPAIAAIPGAGEGATASEPAPTPRLVVPPDAVTRPSPDEVAAVEPASEPPTPVEPDPLPVIEAVPAPAPAIRPAPARTAALPAPQQPAVSATTGYRIQLAAVRDEAAARQAWPDYQSRYPDALGGLVLHVERVATDSGVLSRLQAGYLASRDEASRRCEQIKARGGDCFVTGP